MRAAKTYRVRPSQLLGIDNEWLARAFDLGMAIVSEKETQRNVKQVERRVTGQKGTVFPIIDLYRQAED